MQSVEPIRWHKGQLSILDQTLLPGTVTYRELRSLEDVYEAIQRLRVRGAPAIGCCAAFGLIAGVRNQGHESRSSFAEALAEGIAYLDSSRPTAVNLAWATRRMRDAFERAPETAPLADLITLLEAEAEAIYTEDRALSQLIGKHGAALIQDGDGVLTHCNAGGLATSGYGTALAVMYAAHADGRQFEVYADETRPLLQGARLTTWELQQADIPVTLICDNTAAQVMREGKIQCVIVGADRIAANGDAANKIGTYGVAVLARAHGIPFYVAAPYSTFDLNAVDGDAIPVEMRDAAEIIEGFGTATAPVGTRVYSPAFDVTPAEFIAGIVTERGILRPPFDEAIAEVVVSAHKAGNALA